jgi:LysM repeat protein
VRRGETLGSLARRYRVSVAALMSANGIRSARDLRAGQRLTIPS